MASMPPINCGVTVGAGRGSMQPTHQRQRRPITKRIAGPVMYRRKIPIGCMSVDTLRLSDSSDSIMTIIVIRREDSPTRINGQRPSSTKPRYASLGRHRGTRRSWSGSFERGHSESELLAGSLGENHATKWKRRQEISNAERDGYVEGNGYVKRDAHVKWAGRTALHADERNRERHYPLSPVCERRDCRSGTLPHRRRRLWDLQADQRPGERAERLRGCRERHSHAGSAAFVRDQWRRQFGLQLCRRRRRPAHTPVCPADRERR